MLLYSSLPGWLTDSHIPLLESIPRSVSQILSISKKNLVFQISLKLKAKFLQIKQKKIIPPGKPTSITEDFFCHLNYNISMTKLFVFFINSSLYIFTFVLYINIALKFILSSLLTTISYITRNFSLLFTTKLLINFVFFSNQNAELN